MNKKVLRFYRLRIFEPFFMRFMGKPHGREQNQGITVEIGGDTTKLQTALKGVNTEIRNTQSQLRDVEKLLPVTGVAADMVISPQMVRGRQRCDYRYGNIRRCGSDSRYCGGTEGGAG